MYTTIQKCWVCKEINTFIQEGCIKLIKSDSEGIYKVTDFCFKWMLFFSTLYSWKNPKNVHVSSEILSSTIVFNIANH